MIDRTTISAIAAELGVSWHTVSRSRCAQLAVTGRIPSNDQNLWMSLGEAAQVGAPSRG